MKATIYVDEKNEFLQNKVNSFLNIHFINFQMW